ncbi:MAG: carboxymuconolactone decarboxylase family protein [Hyphomonadaceae bacterium]|nr:carboxymuconolactone decarboxylase family protein [Hyphomonadaceae bacterium]
MSRLEPLPLESLGELQMTLETFKKRMGFIANSGRIMARRPKIVFALGDLARAVLEDGEVSIGLKSCLAEVISWKSGSRYCQAHFANNSIRAGVSPEKFAELWNFEESEHYTEAERSVLRFAQNTAEIPNAVTDEDVVDLQKHWTDGQIVEILATACYVAFLNRWNDSLATKLEDLPKEAAEEHLKDTDWSAGQHGS